MMEQKCESTDLYNSLNWCKGTIVLPGIRDRVFYTKKSNIVKWPVLPESIDEGKTMGALASYVGDFVLAADKKWLSLDILTAESPVTSESQGDMPARTFLNKVTFKHAGVEEDATGFARQANADDLVYLVQQRKGKFRVIGNEMFNTDTKPSQELGAGTGDKAGTSLAVEVTDICPAPFYPGKIETEDGDISGADGSAWSGNGGDVDDPTA